MPRRVSGPGEAGECDREELHVLRLQVRQSRQHVGTEVASDPDTTPAVQLPVHLCTRRQNAEPVSANPAIIAMLNASTADPPSHTTGITMTPLATRCSE